MQNVGRRCRHGRLGNYLRAVRCPVVTGGGQSRRGQSRRGQSRQGRKRWVSKPNGCCGSSRPARSGAGNVDLFLDAHRQAPKQIILDLGAADDPLHGHQEGRFFHGYYDCLSTMRRSAHSSTQTIAHPVRRGHLRHHPLEAVEDWRPRPAQRTPHQDRDGFGLSPSERFRLRPSVADRRRALTTQAAAKPRHSDPGAKADPAFIAPAETGAGCARTLSPPPRASPLSAVTPLEMVWPIASRLIACALTSDGKFSSKYSRGFCLRYIGGPRQIDSGVAGSAAHAGYAAVVAVRQFLQRRALRATSSGLFLLCRLRERGQPKGFP